jgi:hypothetical protein
MASVYVFHASLQAFVHLQRCDGSQVSSLGLDGTLR